jgi:transcription elongation factor Elf1
MLSIACDRCAHEHQDSFEVFESGAIGSMRCESCGSRFSFSIMECFRCESERVFTWTDVPSEAAFAMQMCEKCGSPFGYQDDE